MSARDHHSLSVLDLLSAESGAARGFEDSDREYGEVAFQPKLTTAPQVSLSLKTRERSALALKHIFDQISSGERDAGARNQPSPAPRQNLNLEHSPIHDGCLPCITSRSNVTGRTVRQPTAQLTIFYSGTVNVYDDVPADKANAIMILAGSGNSCPTASSIESDRERITLQVTSPSLAPPPPVTPTPRTPASVGPITIARNTSFSITPVANAPTNNVVNTVSTPPQPSPSPSLPSDNRQQPPAKKPAGIELPHARKASLARFLEKRRDRVITRAPQADVEEKSDGGKDERPSSPKKPCLVPGNDNNNKDSSLPSTLQVPDVAAGTTASASMATNQHR